MAKQIKFTEEEVGKINQLRQEVSNVFTQLGQLTVEREKRNSELDVIKNQLIETHKNLQSEEKKIFYKIFQETRHRPKNSKFNSEFCR